MTLRDMFNNTAVKTSLVPAVRTNGSATGTAVDLRGFDAAVVSVSFGAYTDGSHTPSLQHSVDGVSFTDVAVTDVTGDFTIVDSGAGGNNVQSVGYIGQQRYLRVLMTVTGATSGAASGATIVAGEPHNAPVG